MDTSQYLAIRHALRVPHNTAVPDGRTPFALSCRRRHDSPHYVIPHYTVIPRKFPRTVLHFFNRRKLHLGRRCTLGLGKRPGRSRSKSYQCNRFRTAHGTNYLEIVWHMFAVLIVKGSKSSLMSYSQVCSNYFVEDGSGRENHSPLTMRGSQRGGLFSPSLPATAMKGKTFGVFRNFGLSAFTGPFTDCFGIRRRAQ